MIIIYKDDKTSKMNIYANRVTKENKTNRPP